MNSIFGQHQEMATRTMQATEKKPRPQPDESLKCPRCDSANTKFCYYNNYSLSQPRYFCKSCRRYWTKGGTLRNVPVGGGCRRSRRSVTTSSSRIRTHDHEPLSLFAPFAYESPGLAPFMHKLITGQETYHDLPYPVGPHVRNPFSSAGFLDEIKGGFGLLEDNQYDPSGSYQGLGVRTTAPAAEGMYDDGGCEVNIGGGGENNDGVLLGLPWQVNGDGNCVNLVDVVNSGRGAWNYGNGINSSSSWYNGLVNSPLM